MTIVHAFLANAASKNWHLHQMDVHNSFLHGDLNEEVYLKLPRGFETLDPTLVCRLRKSLYRLKHAPRCMFAKLVSALKSYGFLPSYSDHSLFTIPKVPFNSMSWCMLIILLLLVITLLLSLVLKPILVTVLR